MANLRSLCDNTIGLLRELWLRYVTNSRAETGRLLQRAQAEAKAATTSTGQTGIELRKYGLDGIVNCIGQLNEVPATGTNPTAARIVFLIDERHGNDAIIDDNVQNALAIVAAFPNAAVVLEHFAPGPIDVSTRCLGGDSSFRDKLLVARPVTKLVGGDNVECLGRLLKLKVTKCDEPVSALEGAVPLRGDAVEVARLRRECAVQTDRIKLDYLEESNNHQCQWTRSREMILRAIETTDRVVIINAGANHITHILNNENRDGGPLIDGHHHCSFIRVRAASFPSE